MSAKNLDKKNRWRNKIVSFRMSPEEAQQLDTYVRLSGLNKQDYLINRALQREIVVMGNPRVYKALKTEMTKIITELMRMSKKELSDEQLEVLHQITNTLKGLKEGDT